MSLKVASLLLVLGALGYGVAPTPAAAQGSTQASYLRFVEFAGNFSMTTTIDNATVGGAVSLVETEGPAASEATWTFPIPGMSDTDTYPINIYGTPWAMFLSKSADTDPSVIFNRYDFDPTNAGFQWKLNTRGQIQSDMGDYCLVHPETSLAGAQVVSIASCVVAIASHSHVEAVPL